MPILMSQFRPEKDDVDDEVTVNLTVCDVYSFLNWKDKLNKNYFGGRLMYDIKKYYKRLYETELFDYWLERVHSR